MAVVLKGRGVSEGLAMAQVRVFLRTLPDVPANRAEDIGQELAHLEQILPAGMEELQALREQSVKKGAQEAAEIFDAHMTILEDEYSVVEPIRDRIRNEEMNVAAAIAAQFDELAEMFRSMDDELMQERAADVGDLKRLLLTITLGLPRQDLSCLGRDVILLAEELTPSDTIRMDTAHVKGIVTTRGGATSHSAIIARTLGIPAAAGISGWDVSMDGKPAIFDGTAGVLTVDPSPEEVEAYRNAAAQAEEKAREIAEYRFAPSQTADGEKLLLCANIGTPEEADTAFRQGADGIGLFRSEFLFMDRDKLPTEEEQFAAYRRAAEAMQGKPLIVRTLDVGGDKKIPALPLPHEDNPFLGCRAVRLTLQRPDIFRPQLRALLRASAYGNVQIMFPMICTLSELRAAKALLAQEREALRKEGVEVASVAVGMMIEIPAAALMADAFAREVDFFSIGTNDLTQYTLAVERGNDSVAALYSPAHPAVLRLIEMTAQAAKRHGILCGMCGEAAGDPVLAPAFVGMGVTELSVSPRRIAGLRKQLCEMTLQDCRAAADRLLAVEC